MIRRCFSHFTEEKVCILYKSIIRPTLEYAAPVWAPISVTDINLLERVQRRRMRLCPQNIDIRPLADRRKEIDILETYKLLHNKYKTSPDLFFSKPSREGLRGHSLKIHCQHKRTEIGKQFFSNRVTNVWNDLPDTVVTAPSVASCKERLRALPKE